MESGTRPVKGTRKLIAGMTPVLQEGTFVFCSVFHGHDMTEALRVAEGMFHEDEGLSLILKRADADKFELAYDKATRKITLMVFSSLTSIGLVAAVASEFTKHSIPSKIVTASQHIHIFVYADKAQDAMERLRALQERAQVQL